MKNKEEAEYRQVREENRLQRGEELSVELITELKDGRYRHILPRGISKVLRTRR